MKDNFKTILLVGLLVVCMLIYVQLVKTPEPPVGSVEQGSPYSATQFSGAIATSTTDVVSGKATLGSIIITEDSAIAVEVWDATSTASAVSGDAYSTKIADFEAASAEQEYAFDVAVTYGIVLMPAGTTGWADFAGDWTVTWRRGH